MVGEGGGLHAHLRLSSRPELILVKGGVRGMQRAGGSGLGGWPPVQMISPDSCVFGCVFLLSEGLLAWAGEV